MNELLVSHGWKMSSKTDFVVERIIHLFLKTNSIKFSGYALEKWEV